MSSGNMHNRDGWREVPCEASNNVRGAQPVKVSSSLTDPEGTFGHPVFYTEWATEDGKPVLRDYVWDPTTDDRRCEHLVRADGD